MNHEEGSSETSKEGDVWICLRCQTPIGVGTLYTKTADGRRAHFRCTLAAIGDAVDSGAQIGTPDTE